MQLEKKLEMHSIQWPMGLPQVWKESELSGVAQGIDIFLAKIWEHEAKHIPIIDGYMMRF